MVGQKRRSSESCGRDGIVDVLNLKWASLIILNWMVCERCNAYLLRVERWVMLEKRSG